MSKSKLSLFLVIIALVSSVASFGMDTQEDLTVAVYSNEPLVYYDESAKGFIVDLVNEIASEEGWHVNYVPYDFNDGLRSIESGESDLMLGVAWSEERAERFSFNDEAVFVNWGQIYTNPKSNVQSFQDLEGRRIGVMKGDIHYLGENGLKMTLKQFGIHVTFVEYDDKMDILAGLESGFVDAAIVNRTFGMKHAGNFAIKKTSIQLNPVNLHIIAPKNRNEDLLSRLDSYLYSWKNTEESYYHKKLVYWFESAVSEQVPLWIWVVLASASGLLVVSALIIYATQRVIQNQTKALRELNHNLEDKVAERTEELDNTNQQLKTSLITLEEKQSELEEMNAILEEQVDMIERTQNQLVEAEKMASLGRMVASLSHELNTPLGICVTLQSNMKVDSKRLLKALEENKLTKNCLTEYLNDMLSVSDMFNNNLEAVVDLVDRFKMLSTDRVHMNERKINLYEYLHTQMDALSPELKLSSHKYNIACPKDLNMVVDPAALSQVIRNLTMNSLIHGFEDKPSGQIDIQVRKNKERVLIEYSDDGKGIQPDIKSKMFEPFFTTKRNQGGTGLGLSIVHSAVTQSLDGEIRIDDRRKNGLKYEIELPFREKEAGVFSVPNLSYKMTYTDKD